MKTTFASGLFEAMEYAVAAGGLAGNGVTVIANLGNPAGQAILARTCQGGIAPPGLFGRRCQSQQSLVW